MYYPHPPCPPLTAFIGPACRVMHNVCSMSSRCAADSRGGAGVGEGRGEGLGHHLQGARQHCDMEQRFVLSVTKGGRTVEKAAGLLVALTAMWNALLPCHRGAPSLTGTSRACQ